MRDWLFSLNLPWAHIRHRWMVTLTLGDLSQRLADSALLALREWWPSTARDRTLAVYAAVLNRPRRQGEPLPDWRHRLAAWRSEQVATTGWVRDEVSRIAGAARVIDWPRDSMRIGYGRIGHTRIGSGPALLIGAPQPQIATLRLHLETELPPDVGLTVVTSSIFDEV